MPNPSAVRTRCSQRHAPDKLLDESWRTFNTYGAHAPKRRPCSITLQSSKLLAATSRFMMMAYKHGHSVTWLIGALIHRQSLIDGADQLQKMAPGHRIELAAMTPL